MSLATIATSYSSGSFPPIDTLLQSASGTNGVKHEPSETPDFVTRSRSASGSGENPLTVVTSIEHDSALDPSDLSNEAGSHHGGSHEPSHGLMPLSGRSSDSSKPGPDYGEEQDYMVTHWGKVDEKQKSRPEVEVWLVKCLAEEKKVKVWAMDGSTKITELCNLYSFEVISVLLRGVSGGFINGRPLIRTAIPITTCSRLDRPEFIYRVIHDGNDETEGTPNGGIQARGYPTRRTDPICFQIMLQKHFEWNSREKSPFMSAVNTYERAIKTCKTYRTHGFTNIRVLKIKTTGPGWDHTEQRLWHAQHLIEVFKLTRHERCN